MNEMRKGRQAMHELRLRARYWWNQHWWPARIRQLDQERADWKRWCEDAEAELNPVTVFSVHPDDSGDFGWITGTDLIRQGATMLPPDKLYAVVVWTPDG